MTNGSNYGQNIVIVQERQFRPYSVASSASRSTGTSSNYTSSTMDSPSPSSSRSSSTYPDRTGTYRNGGADGYNTAVKTNKKGKREVVIINHGTKHSDPAEPRSGDRYSYRT